MTVDDLDFDLPGPVPPPKPAPSTDPLRPNAVRGRYYAPTDPATGLKKKGGWQRTTNLIKLAENTYHLELWKQRCVARGLVLDPELLKRASPLRIREDKEALNKICEKAMEAAGANKASDAGTRLHKLTELHDMGLEPPADLTRAESLRLEQYRLLLSTRGIRTTPGLVERLTVSLRYDVAGTFDRIVELADGSWALADLKTSSSLDLSMHSISAQLAVYQDGISQHGLWTGSGYDRSIRVREDFALIIHLPSDGGEGEIYEVDLAPGHELASLCCEVRRSQKTKARDVSRPFRPEVLLDGREGTEDARWLEELNAAHTVEALVAVAERARYFGQWNNRLADAARKLAAEARGQ